MDFNASPLDKLSRQLLKCRNKITTLFVFSFIVVLSRHSAVVFKLFTSEIFVATNLNLLRHFFYAFVVRIVATIFS